MSSRSRSSNFDYFLSSQFLRTYDFSYVVVFSLFLSSHPLFLSVILSLASHRLTRLVRMRQHAFTRGYTCTLYASARCLSTSTHIPHKRLSDVVVIARRADHRYTTWRKNKGPHYDHYVRIPVYIQSPFSENHFYTLGREWTQSC